jgi:hypothetical protein
MKRFSKTWLVTVVCVALAMGFLSGRFFTNDKLAAPQIKIISECSAATSSYICTDSMGAQNIRQSCQDMCQQQFQSALPGQMSSCNDGCQKYYNLLWQKGKVITQ